MAVSKCFRNGSYYFYAFKKHRNFYAREASFKASF